MVLNGQKPLNLSHINAWVFDLDNTIYPADSDIFPQVMVRMTHYLEERFNIDANQASALRKELFDRHGTTARGLVQEYDIDPAEFLDYVHDIDLSKVEYDPDLDAGIGKIQGKKIIFTNGTTEHANRILKCYKIAHHFDHCYDIFSANHRPKPDPMTYDDMLTKTEIDPNRAIMIEDMAINLKPAHELGMTTVWLNHEATATASSSDLPEAQAPYIDYIAKNLKSFLQTLG